MGLLSGFVRSWIVLANAISTDDIFRDLSGTGSHSNDAVFCNLLCSIMESVQYYGIRCIVL